MAHATFVCEVVSARGHDKHPVEGRDTSSVSAGYKIGTLPLCWMTLKCRRPCVDQVFTCALKQLGLTYGDTEFGSKTFRIVSPHRQAAIETTTRLAMKSEQARNCKRWVIKGSKVEGTPITLMRSITGTNCNTQLARQASPSSIAHY